MRLALYSSCGGTTGTACGRLTVESGRCPDAVQAVLERKETKLSMTEDIFTLAPVIHVEIVAAPAVHWFGLWK